MPRAGKHGCLSGIGLENNVPRGPKNEKLDRSCSGRDVRDGAFCAESSRRGRTGAGGQDLPPGAHGIVAVQGRRRRRHHSRISISRGGQARPRRRRRTLRGSQRANPGDRLPVAEVSRWSAGDAGNPLINLKSETHGCTVFPSTGCQRPLAARRTRRLAAVDLDCLSEPDILGRSECSTSVAGLDGNNLHNIHTHRYTGPPGRCCARFVGL